MARLEDNFYEYVNEDWLKEAEIPGDKASTGSFHQIDDALEKLMMELSENWLTSKEPVPDDKRIKEYVKLLAMARNYDQREKDGVKPVLPYLSWFDENITSWQDVAQNYKRLILDGFSVPYDFGVSIDMKDTSKHALYASSPALIFPDRTYYERDDEQIEALAEVYKSMALEIAEAFGVEDPKDLVERAINYDKNFAPYTKSGEEQADYVKAYNPYSLKELDKHSSEFSLAQIAQSLVGPELTELIVEEPKFLENLDSIVNDESFDDYRAWIFLNFMLDSSALLSDDLRVKTDAFRKVLSGIKESKSKEKSAYYLAHGYFSIPVGTYYAKKYFGPDAKKDVEQMARNVIKVYKERLSHNNWLSQETIDKAIVKLDAIDLHVGYPEHIQEFYDELEVVPYDQGGSLFSNTKKFSKIMREYNFDKYSKPVENDLWSMSPDMVNAYYNPQLNHIVFPAGILQEPFYDLSQHPSANYGGIGAVIAHEISHAFDNNGSQFDEFGNLADWWTKEDFEQFDARAQKMIEAWNGEKSFGGEVNGTLTVSENIADAGGISCALEAAKMEDDYNADEFFKNWARVWRFKSSEEYAQMLLAVDVHAPAPLRGNVQLKHLDEFYSTYDIKPGDGMYLPEDKRVQIW